MTVSFGNFVIRIKQLLLVVGILVAFNLVDISLLHIPHLWEDRLKYVGLLIVALNRPIGYYSKEVNDESRNTSTSIQ